MTPGGTCNLLSALKEVFENGTCVPGNGTCVPGNGTCVPGNGTCVPGNGSSGEGECKMAEPAPMDRFPVGVKSEH